MLRGDPPLGEDGKSIPGAKDTIPRKYNAETMIEFEVEPGKKNVANFDLLSRRRVAEGKLRKLTTAAKSSGGGQPRTFGSIRVSQRLEP